VYFLDGDSCRDFALASGVPSLVSLLAAEG
jgi:hypothetical protein